MAHVPGGGRKRKAGASTRFAATPNCFQMEDKADRKEVRRIRAKSKEQRVKREGEGDFSVRSLVRAVAGTKWRERGSENITRVRVERREGNGKKIQNSQCNSGKRKEKEKKGKRGRIEALYFSP